MVPLTDKYLLFKVNYYQIYEMKMIALLKYNNEIYYHDAKPHYVLLEILDYVKACLKIQFLIYWQKIINSVYLYDIFPLLKKKRKISLIIHHKFMYLSY